MLYGDMPSNKEFVEQVENGKWSTGRLVKECGSPVTLEYNEKNSQYRVSVEHTVPYTDKAIILRGASYTIDLALLNLIISIKVHNHLAGLQEDAHLQFHYEGPE